MAFRLETFGGLTLRNSHGTPMAVQRRRLGLLAVLAAAGQLGVTRDTLFGFMWPENTDESARHSLDQLLYGLRRSIDDSLFIGVDPLRLNPDVVQSDVQDFERLLAAGSLEQATALYRGTFLDGFHLGGAAGFDHWLERQRSIFANQYADALDRLAAKAAESGTHSLEIDYRLKLAAHEPVSARRTLQLMRALADAGDITGALRHARTFESLVRSELNAPADPSVLAYAAELQLPQQVNGNQPGHKEAGVAATEAGTVTEPVARSPSAPVEADTRDTRRLLAVVAGVVAVVIVGAFILHGRGKSGSHGNSGSSALSRNSTPSVAVLASENASQDSAVDYYSYGLTDALIDRLTASGSLRVIQGPSAFILRGHRADTRGIADSLGVSSLLSSGVLMEGNDLRISVKLIDGRDGAVLWSRNYRGNWDQRFVLQESVESEVSRELALRIPGAQNRSVRSKLPRTARAYELYLRGRHQWNTQDSPPMVTMRAAIDYFKQALAEDSTYAEAYAGLAASYAIIGTGNLSDFNQNVAVDSARAAATTAVLLNDSLPEAHAALGMVRLLFDLDFEGANAELSRARQLNPFYSRAPLWPTTYFEWKGQSDLAVQEAERTVSTDPLSANAVVDYARTLFFAQRYGDAKAQLERARGLDAMAERLNLTAGEIALKEKNYPLALAQFQRFAVLTHQSSRAVAFLANAYGTAGNRTRCQAMIKELERRYAGGKAVAFDFVIAYAGLGDIDGAFMWLDRSIGDRSIRPLIMDPTFSAVHADPRFEWVLKRLKLRT